MTLGAQLRSFVVIGVICTLAFGVLYALLRAADVAVLPANAIALAITMVGNFVANRHLTFAAGGEPLLPQLVGYAVAYAVGLAASSLVLLALLAVLGDPAGLVETGAAVFAGLAATGVRFVLMRRWVFRARPLAAQP